MLKSEIDKIINTLSGILKGIAIDKEINNIELEELSNWCRLYQEYIYKSPFNEILPILNNSISARTLKKDEVEDILWVANNFITSNLYYDALTSDIQKLHGIFHGILSDNKITDEELIQLKKWINENEHLISTYPYDEINSLLTAVFADGKVDEIERKTLKLFFSDFINTKNSHNVHSSEIESLKKEIQIHGICSVCPKITFKLKSFCFTGTSSKVKRDDIKNIILSVGGSFNNNVNKDTNYLIIGNEGNSCWAFSCYGRKVEKAIDLRKKGNSILIVHENDFWDAYEDVKK